MSNALEKEFFAAENGKRLDDIHCCGCTLLSFLLTKLTLKKSWVAVLLAAIAIVRTNHIQNRDITVVFLTQRCASLTFFLKSSLIN